MREVTTAKSAGFCFGVRRAVDMVYAEAKKDNRVFTLGPIIHNEQVVKDLEKKGVKVIDSVNDISEKENTTIIMYYYSCIFFNNTFTRSAAECHKCT